MARFGGLTKLLWGALAVTAVVLELIPAHYPAGIFSTYNCCKAGLFLSLGYLAPVAFWRFNYLNASIMWSAGSAGFVEVMQAVLSNGHRFSITELSIKMLLICAGFVIALDVRYERDCGRVQTRSTVQTL